MCKHLTKAGRKCALSPQKDACHIHKKPSIIDHRVAEIRNLNKSISKKNATIKTLKTEVGIVKAENENLRIELNEFKQQLTTTEAYSEKTISKKNATIKTLKSEVGRVKDELNQLKHQMESMKEDSDKYARIKNFELTKSKLSKHVIDIGDIYEMKKFCRNSSNANILKEIFGDRVDYWKYYNEMRLKRNRLCHFD